MNLLNQSDIRVKNLIRNFPDTRQEQEYLMLNRYMVSISVAPETKCS
jgi:hypothetical protein